MRAQQAIGQNIRRHVVCLFASAIVMCSGAARADSFESGNARFDVHGVGIAQVQAMILTAAMIAGVDWNAGVHPVVTRWRRHPCYVAANATDAEMSSLERTLYSVDSVISFDISRCPDATSASITYDFTEGQIDARRRSQILSLMGNPPTPTSSLESFLEFGITCYAHFSFEASKDEGISKAIVLVNARALSDEQLNRCLLLSTSIALGMSRPIGMFGNPLNQTATEWEKTEVLNLLSLNVLYHLNDGAMQGTKRDVESAVNELLQDMHVSDK
jgi:hypothetical protein